MRLTDMTGLFRVSLIALALATVICSSHAQTGAAMLRIDCSGSNAKTEVYVDDKFRGECPVDIQVQEGSRKLRFYKKIDQQTEQVLENSINIGGGTIKRLEVMLPEPQLSAIGKKERDQQLSLADAGDMHAQYALAVRYLFGDGVEQDNKKADHWFKRSAEAGHIFAGIIRPGDQWEINSQNDGIVVRNILKTLGDDYARSRLTITQDKSLDEMVKLNIMGPNIRDIRFTYDWGNFKIDGSYFFDRLIMERAVVIGIGSSGANTHRYPHLSVSLKKINYLIGDPAKPVAEQGGIFGFDLEEEIQVLITDPSHSSFGVKKIVPRTVICGTAQGPMPLESLGKTFSRESIYCLQRYRVKDGFSRVKDGFRIQIRKMHPSPNDLRNMVPSALHVNQLLYKYNYDLLN